MKKSDLKFMPKFFDRYINLVSDEETLFEGFENSLNEVLVLKEVFETHENYRYEEGKWTPKELLLHIIDTERILSYRALVYARNDKNILPGFDENLYAENANVDDRTITDLLEELVAIRKSSLFLFKNLSKRALHREGVCFEVKMNVLALGFVIVGHPRHHLNILQERYFV